MRGTERTPPNYRLFLESIPLVPWKADARTGRFTYLGPQAADFLGYPVEDWYRNGFWAERLHPDDRERVIETCPRLSGVVGPSDLEYRMVRASGDIMWVRDVVSVDLEEDGPVSLRGYLTDVTEPKRLELALTASELRLTQLLTDRKRAEAELAQVSRVSNMGELAASIAHELNQPLSAIIANAQAARHLLESDPPDLLETIDALADIVSDGERAGAVISQMRGLLESGEHAEESVRLDALAVEVGEMLRSEAIGHGASLTVVVEADLPSIVGDATQLKQVLLNLVLNALEAGTQVNGEGHAVTVTASSSAGELELTVSDNGPGLPEGRVEDLFAPFKSTKPGGLGVGLSISRTIVEAHGGRLLAMNIPQGGARFVVRLPAPGHGPL